MEITTTTLKILNFCRKVKLMDFSREEFRSYIDNHFDERRWYQWDNRKKTIWNSKKPLQR